MANEALFKATNVTRSLMLKAIDGLTDEQLLKTPEGSKNNILWNLGHIAHSSCGMTYGMSGLDLPVPATYADLFKGGSSPADWSETPDCQEVVEHMKSLNQQIQTDYEAGKFDGFKARELFPGYSLDNPEDAIHFNIFHEAVHLSTVTALKKQVT